MIMSIPNNLIISVNRNSKLNQGVTSQLLLRLWLDNRMSQHFLLNGLLKFV